MTRTFAARRRLGLLQVVAALGLLAALLAAPRLWLGHWPLAPLPALEGLGRPLEWLAWPLYAALLAGLSASLHPRAPRWVLPATLACLVLRAAPDRALWQPYVLQYGFLLACAAGRRDGEEAAGTALDAARLATAGLYFWSGVSKISHGFASQIFADLVGGVHPALLPFAIPALALSAAAGEAVCGALLALGRLRRAALLFLAGMHVFILLSIGPTGLDVNSVVWPWNMAMLALLGVLFLGADERREARKGRPRRLLPRAAAALFVVLPGLSYLGLWPAYLSFRLYSDRFDMCSFHLSKALAARLDPRDQAALDPSPSAEGMRFVMFQLWGEQVVGAHLPPDRALARQVARRLCRDAADPKDLRLTIRDPPERLTGRTRMGVETCERLLPERIWPLRRGR